FRFHEEFFWAVQLISEQRIPLQPLLTGVYAVDDAVAAFEVANDRHQSMKVQLTF
ncbi:MAG: L-idonate 5-dehydrogenase, partial [Gammaproteobacteria bacterium]|nr:L-idonate 5-dehydrogenase [Gammaproteobacteria bacterium]